MCHSRLINHYPSARWSKEPLPSFSPPFCQWRLVGQTNGKWGRKKRRRVKNNGIVGSVAKSDQTWDLLDRVHVFRGTIQRF